MTRLTTYVGQPFRAAVRKPLVVLVAALLAASPVFAATRYDPGLRFRSITTPHFVIHFHQGEEPLARRLAAIVEDVHDALTRRMGRTRAGRTHVVLVDQSDQANGWATPLPYNLIEITAVEPVGTSLIGNTSDWLRLVFTHEYAHVLHLDRSRGWARGARAIFGRTPLAFPNLTLPLWQIEGLATFEESRSGEGRVNAGDFHSIVREASRAGRFEPIDRVSGGLTDWPGGHGWYAYGGFFHAFLAERYGEERIAELSDRTAGRIPYLTSGAFEAVFGHSLGELWREFRESERTWPAAGAATPVERLTFTGHFAGGPRFDRDGSILFSRSDPHGLPSLERLTAGGRVERLTSRIGGEHVAIADAAVYFDQLELQRSVARVGDLYRLDRRTQEVTRLTSGARLADPDVAPDGSRVAVVAVGGGRRELVIVPRQALETGSPEFSTAGLKVCPAAVDEPCRMPLGEGTAAAVARPRWSPDGRRIAVESRGGSGISEILVLDVATAGRVLAVSSHGRNVTPAWTPDGGSIVFASDRSGDSFDLYRAWLSPDGRSVTGVERLTSVPGGAHSPDLAPDGRSVVFVGYTPDGYDLFRMTLGARPAELKFGPTEGTGRQAELKFGATDGTGRQAELKFGATSDVPVGPNSSPVAPNFSSAEGVSDVLVAPNFSSAEDVSSAAADYNPFPTVFPRAWLPIVELDDDQVEIGAATAGVDALGYHAWSAAATWPAARRDEFDGLPWSRARPDFQIAYAYDRWRPTFFMQVEDDTSPLLVGQAGSAERQPLLIQDRSVAAGFTLPFRRLRWSHSLTAAWRLEHRTLDTREARATQTRGALRAGWGLSTAKRYGYSISPEAGVSTGIAVELSRRALGADLDATFTRLDVRAYVPVVPRRGVLAVRASGVASRGDVRGRRSARLGGADGDPGVVSFDEDASSLLRGFPSNAFQGDTVALINAEYRVPLGWPQRGFRTWPVFLRSVHATVFGDAGHAWSGRFRFSDVKSSWGAELSADLTAAYALPLTCSAGVAWGKDHSGRADSSRRFYVRLGHSF